MIRVDRFLYRQSLLPPWTATYALSRTLLATSTLLTLLFNRSSDLFIPAVGVSEAPLCGGVRGLGIFCVIENLEIARWIAILLLLVVLSGWRPRFTGILHWWISASVQWNALLLDGGDQVAMVLSLFLLPVALTDPRRWHWGNRLGHRPRTRVASLVGWSGILASRIQVSIIYLYAFVSKFAVQEWRDGTVLYYWFSHPVFGLPDPIRSGLDPVLVNDTMLPLLVWSSLAIEYLLSASLFGSRLMKACMFPVGLLFHLVIAWTFGLPSFSLAMSGALVIYLLPVARPAPRLLWAAGP